jgi:hypothetical protein
LTAEEIMNALRLTAMGRVGHPEQQRLCDALAKLMAEPEGIASWVGETTTDVVGPVTLPDIPSIVTPNGLNIPGAINQIATADVYVSNYGTAKPGVNIWAGNHGEYPIPDELYASVKLTKSGMPDRRHKGNEPFWAWVAEQEAAAQKAE